MWSGLFAIAAAPFFYSDVKPILDARCGACHTAGGIAPMSFGSYAEVRPYAKAILDALVRGKMPPWFADSRPGEFANDPRLTASELDTVRRWVNSGAPEGTPAMGAAGPSALRFVPDAVFRMPEPFEVPAKGEVDYQHVIVPTGFQQDRWVQSIEVRPSEPSVVHHAVVFVRPPRSVWLRDQAAGPLFTAKGAALRGLSTLDEVIGTYLPGSPPARFPDGHAKLIPAGSELIFQIHYTPNGRVLRDRTEVRIAFATERPMYRIYSVSVAEGGFEIPPMTPEHRVRAEFRVHTPAEIYSLAPHMHLRGKSMTVRLVEPDDTERMLVSVPAYDFHWQLTYRPRKPVAVPRGARLVVDAVFDNSPNNKRNPDPKARVRWGEQSREEMLVCFVDFILPAVISPNELYRSPL